MSSCSCFGYTTCFSCREAERELKALETQKKILEARIENNRLERLSSSYTPFTRTIVVERPVPVSTTIVRRDETVSDAIATAGLVGIAAYGLGHILGNAFGGGDESKPAKKGRK
jgi:hypothetical protein